MKKLLLLLLWLVCISSALAVDIDMQLQNPQRNVGYTIGDVISRTVVLKVPAPYLLLPKSLPIPGYQRRYRGQETGIELRHINVQTKRKNNHTIYTLQLSYQVFTSNILVKPAHLPAEVIWFGDGKRSFDYRIPSWTFRMSPLAIYGDVKIEQDMTPYHPPLLLEDRAVRYRLYGFLILLAVSVLGLLYIWGRYTLLPRMGGSFARAYRQISSTSDIPSRISLLHQALNQTLGRVMFREDIHDLLMQRPAFAAVQHDLELFFQLSAHEFFGQPFEAIPREKEVWDVALWLQQFSLRCRHCERGLR